MGPLSSNPNSQLSSIPQDNPAVSSNQSSVSKKTIDTKTSKVSEQLKSVGSSILSTISSGKIHAKVIDSSAKVGLKETMKNALSTVSEKITQLFKRLFTEEKTEEKTPADPDIVKSWQDLPDLTARREAYAREMENKAVQERIKAQQEKYGTGS